MTGRLRVLAPLGLVALVVVGAFALTGSPVRPGSSPGSSPGRGSGGPQATGGPVEPEPSPTPRPAEGGTELYGFLPYWQMTDAVAAHLRSTPVSTVALFSVTARRNGELNTSLTGYRRITGDVGRRLIREAHDRGASVEIVFTSFGPARNGRFFGRIGASPAASG